MIVFFSKKVRELGTFKKRLFIPAKKKKYVTGCSDSSEKCESSEIYNRLKKSGKPEKPGNFGFFCKKVGEFDTFKKRLFIPAKSENPVGGFVSELPAAGVLVYWAG